MAQDKEEMINKFVEIREFLMKNLTVKYEALDDLKEEIENLKIKIRDIEKLIGKTSFLSAEAMLEDKDIFEKAENSKVQDIDFTRKIFSSSRENQLLTIVKFNGARLDVYFPNPQVTKLKATSEVYLNDLIGPLLELKEKEPAMDISISKQNDQDLITKLTINGVGSYESAEYIYSIFEKIFEDIS